MSVRVSNTELRPLLRRAPLPIGVEDVALVLQIGDAHLAGPEPRRREIAEVIEELDAVVQPLGSLVGPRDIVEHGGALRRAGAPKGGPEPVVALGIEARGAAAHPQLVVRIRDGDEVHEFGNAGGGRRARPRARPWGSRDLRARAPSATRAP